MAETIEPEFLGDHLIFTGVLTDYVLGKLDKKTMQGRARYAQVLDLKRLKEDIRMNCVNERTFHCIDKSFFMDGFSLSDRAKPSVRLADDPAPAGKGFKNSKIEEEEKKAPVASVISKKPGKQVEDDDFGFCFSESEDEGEGPAMAGDAFAEVTGLNFLDNKFIKEDMALLSSLCSDILS